MRLVSKAWLAAVTAYPGILEDIEIEKQADLAKLRKLMPNMVGLEIGSDRDKLNLKPLSALKQLTYLNLSGADPFFEEDELQADLSPLPESLRKLKVSRVYVPPDCFKNLKFGELRSLSFGFGQNKQAEIWRLLRYLPVLEVDLIAGSLYGFSSYPDNMIISSLSLNLLNETFAVQNGQSMRDS